METLRFRAMNTDVLLAAEGPADEVAEGFVQARQFVHASEARFTRFTETSELAALNRSAGSRFHASADLFTVVALAQHFFHRTRGLFDPSILPDLQRLGYDRSMDLIRTQGAGPLLETWSLGKRPSFAEVELDEAQRAIRLPAGMSLDLGGIAKGWIAEQAALILSKYASACAVNAGGDMFLVGAPEGEEQWSVALEDPLQPEATLAQLKVAPGALVTSAVTKRTWKQDGKPRHHLIDPRTGEPAQTDWLSVTVFARHAGEAEVFAKALLIGGPGEAEAIARSGDAISYLAVDRERKLWGSQKSLEHLDVN